MEAQEVKQIVERAIDQNFYCNGGECEAGHCRARLVHIEEMLEHLIEGTSRSLNSIVEFLKEEKHHD